MRVGLWRTVCSGRFQNCYFSAHLSEVQGDYFPYLLWEPGRVPQGKTSKMFKFLWIFKLSDLYTLSLCQFISYSSGFPAPVLAQGVSAVKSCDPSTCLYLPFWGQQFAQWVHFSDRSKDCLFLFAQLFTCENRVITSKVIPCWTRKLPLEFSFPQTCPHWASWIIFYVLLS